MGHVEVKRQYFIVKLIDHNTQEEYDIHFDATITVMKDAVELKIEQL